MSETFLADSHESAARAAQMLSLRDRLDRCQGELVRVRRQMEALEASAAALRAECAMLHEDRGGMARLYVACRALHATLDRARVLDAVEDLLINLAATEEWGVYETEPDGAATLVRAFGIDAVARAPLPASPLVAEAMASGAPVVGAEAFDGRAPAEGRGHPVAALPLVVDGRTAGVVVIWSYLPQKPGPEPADEETYAVLSTHVAVALLATRPAAGAA
jgi:hypothetical protein